MKKIKRISRFLLFCLISSYLQFFPAFVEPAFAQEVSEETCVFGELDQTCAVSNQQGLCSIGSRECLLEGVWGECAQTYYAESEICDNALDDDCDGFRDAEDPDCQLEDLDLEIPIVKIYAEDGVLKYKLENEDEYEGLDVTYETEWFENIPDKDGDLTRKSVSLENEYKPQNSGTYSITLTVKLKTEEEELRSSAEDEFLVNFPIFDQKQFEHLEYRAGERFTLKYFDKEGEIAELTGKIEDKALEINRIKNTNLWEFEGSEIIKSGDYTLSLTAVSEGGFGSEFVTVFTVLPSEVNAASSKFELLQNGVEIEYVPTNSEALTVRFTAYDEYLNGINVSNIDRVDIRLNGELLEGVDLIGDNRFVVERIVNVPEIENLNAVITVDVFDSECKGVLFIGEQKIGHYCFGKTKNLVIYDEGVSPVRNLEYPEKTRDSSVSITGEKGAGYGIKINSVDSAFILNPNENDSFSFTIPLAEGLNSVKIFTVKMITDELTFFSDPVEIVIEKDTRITPPSWNDPAITVDGENQATLHWTDPIYLSSSDFDFSHVNIYRSTFPNFVPSADNLVVQTHNPSWTDTGLASGVEYYYLIEAVDNVGNTAMINKIQSTGEITSDSATSANEDNWYENLFAGKGNYDEGNIEGEEALSEDETGDSEEGNGEQDEEISNNSEGTPEFEDSKTNNLFNKIKDGVKSVSSKLSKNIFVQICCGGVIIFLALMILISILVWVKEKIVDRSLSLSSESETHKGKKFQKPKSDSKKKKRKH